MGTVLWSVTAAFLAGTEGGGGLPAATLAPGVSGFAGQAGGPVAPAGRAPVGGTHRKRATGTNVAAARSVQATE